MAGLLGASVLLAPLASAGPTVCDDLGCIPGIMSHVVFGASCDDATYYVSFASRTGRLMLCGPLRRYEPQWFRSPGAVTVTRGES